MDPLKQAMPELEKLISDLHVNTADVHGVFRAVLANLHVRLANLESVAVPVLEKTAATIATDAIEGK